MSLILLTFVIVWLTAFVIRKVLDVFIRKRSSQMRVDPTNFKFLKNSISFICFSIGLFFIFTKIPYFKTLGTALFASAGILAAILGFASQKAVANIIGGVFILIFKPFRVGDAVKISSGSEGIIEEITLRHTVIRDYEFRRVIIPNSIVSEDTITNSSIADEKIRKFIEFGIAYDADIDLAEKIIQQEIEKHPKFMDLRTIEEIARNTPKVPIKVISLGDFSVNLRAFAWVEDFDSSIDLQRDVFRSVKLAFDKEGIEIPFPHRTIVFKNKDAKSKDDNIKKLN